MEAFPGGIPSRELLDAVVPDRPVFLPNRDGHGAWVNSTALRLAGIDDITPDPPDGRIERDADGVAVGMLQEGAAALVGRLLPVITPDDWYAALLTAQDHLLAFGITGWQDAIIGDYQDGVDPLPAYRRADENGALQASVVGALWWDRQPGPRAARAPACTGARRRPGERFVATSVKMMLDGVAENHTAAMLEPYLDADGCAERGRRAGLHRSATSFPSSSARSIAKASRCTSTRSVIVRCAMRSTRSKRPAPRTRHGTQRHHLAHLQVVHPDDVARFAPLRATANIQSLWAQHDSQMDDLTIPFLGDRRAGWQYPFRSLQAAGAAMCAGSDWPVTSPNPFLAIHVAVNRTPAASRRAARAASPFLPEQAISLTAALSGYTTGSAKVNGVDDSRRCDQAGLRRRPRRGRRRSRPNRPLRHPRRPGRADVDPRPARPRVAVTRGNHAP